MLHVFWAWESQLWGRCIVFWSFESWSYPGDMFVMTYAWIRTCPIQTDRAGRRGSPRHRLVTHSQTCPRPGKRTSAASRSTRECPRCWRGNTQMYTGTWTAVYVACQETDEFIPGTDEKVVLTRKHRQIIIFQPNRFSGESQQCCRESMSKYAGVQKNIHSTNEETEIMIVQPNCTVREYTWPWQRTCLEE